MNIDEAIMYAIKTSHAIKDEKKEQLTDYFCQMQQENKKYKEVIDKAKKLHNEFASKNSLLVFENNNLIDFMNNLISVLKEVEHGKHENN